MISAIITEPMISPAVASTAELPITSTSVLALIVVITFLALVAQKEVAGFGSQRLRLHRDLARGLNIGIIPLGIASGTVAVVRLLHAYA